MSMKTIVKTISFKVMPVSILNSIKRYYYFQILRSFSESDEEDFKVIKCLVRVGDFVIDIGANIGVYTKYLSQLVGINGHVYSIEPIPLTFNFLSCNVEKFRLKNVNLFNIAISDKEAIVTMEIPLYESGGDNFYEARITNGSSNNLLRKFNVESKTIDSLFAKISNKISFIKCDVEGHELYCLKGAINTIKNHKPALLVEISRDSNELESTTNTVFKFLGEYGYEAFWFNGSKLKKKKIEDKSVNYFFLTLEHLHILQKQSNLIIEII